MVITKCYGGGGNRPANEPTRLSSKLHQDDDAERSDETDSVIDFVVARYDSGKAAGAAAVNTGQAIG